MRINPPSKDFFEIGAGSAARAYTEPLRKKVEIITKPVNNWYDASRDIVIAVREKLPNHLKKFLPEIKQLRIDKSKSGEVEFIYQMDFYREPKSLKKIIMPTQDDIQEIQETFRSEFLRVYKLSMHGIKAKFDGKYESDDSLDKCPIFNLAVSDSQPEHIIYRDPVVAWMDPSDIIAIYWNSNKSNNHTTVSRLINHTTVSRLIATVLS